MSPLLLALLLANFHPPIVETDEGPVSIWEAEDDT